MSTLPSESGISMAPVALPPAKNKSPKTAPSRQPEEVPPISTPAPLRDKIIMLMATIGPLVGTIAAIAYAWTNGWMGWKYLVLFLAAWAVSGMGVTIGFHRLLTHGSFETFRPIRAMWMFFGALSVEGSPLIWCAVHRKHHQLSDHLGDPHSPHLHGTGVWNTIKGLWYAQVGWLFTNHWSMPDVEKYVPDLLQDKLLVSVDRMYYLWVLASLAIPMAIGGFLTGSWSWEGAWLGLLWGGFVRIFVGHHITWSINSICHVFGQRQYETTDYSTNNVVCAIAGWGEGWHNNHHAFPTSARHGLSWWQFDTSWMVIRTMELCGLAWNVKVPSERVKAQRRIRKP
ncbi:MAG: fatty acid desaturase [Pirellulales bacterium]